MTSLFFDEMIRELNGPDCRIVAGVAAELAAAEVHVRPSDLERAHDCVTGASGGRTRVELARLFLALQEPGERAGQAVRLLHEVPDLDVRIEAFHALSHPEAPAVAELCALASDPDAQLREYALQALRRAGGAAPLDVLVSGLADPDFAARWTAGNALIDREAAALVPLLRAIVTVRPSRTFHDAARRVLHRLPAPSDLQAGIDALVVSLNRHTSIYEAGALAFELLQRVTAASLSAVEGFDAAEAASRAPAEI